MLSFHRKCRNLVACARGLCLPVTDEDVDPEERRVRHRVDQDDGAGSAAPEATTTPGPAPSTPHVVSMPVARAATAGEPPAAGSPPPAPRKLGVYPALVMRDGREVGPPLAHCSALIMFNCAFYCAHATCTPPPRASRRLLPVVWYWTDDAVAEQGGCSSLCA